MEAWRNAGKKGTSISTTSESTGTLSSGSVSHRTQAELLAKTMEAEHEKVVAQILQQQEEARLKIMEVDYEFLFVTNFISAYCRFLVN